MKAAAKSNQTLILSEKPQKHHQNLAFFSRLHYPFERRVVSNVIDKTLANEEP
jgi:hypothetical protein